MTDIMALLESHIESERRSRDEEQNGSWDYVEASGALRALRNLRDAIRRGSEEDPVLDWYLEDASSSYREWRADVPSACFLVHEERWGDRTEFEWCFMACCYGGPPEKARGTSPTLAEAQAACLAHWQELND